MKPKKNIHKPLNLTAIILTYNEEIHIQRCVKSIIDIVDEIVIVDSYSTDKTIQKLKKFKKFKKIRIFKNRFINQAKQINWALHNVKFSTQWILRIDADEYFTKTLKEKIIIKLKNKQKNFSGISLNRIVKFINREINFGITSPHKTLRIWKKNKGKCLDHWMDEQIIVEGRVTHVDNSLIDHNINNFDWWLEKHRKYAKREAINFFLINNNLDLKDKPKKNLRQINDYYKNKYNKIIIYYKIPIFIRPIFLFLYSYIFKLGFLSSWQGLIFNLFQVLWFRFLVDLNIFKIQKKMKKEKLQFKQIINKMYDFPKI